MHLYIRMFILKRFSHNFFKLLEHCIAQESLVFLPPSHLDLHVMLNLEAQPTLLVSLLSLPGSSSWFCTEYSLVLFMFSQISEISHTILKTVISMIMFLSMCLIFSLLLMYKNINKWSSDGFWTLLHIKKKQNPLLNFCVQAMWLLTGVPKYESEWFILNIYIASLRLLSP